MKLDLELLRSIHEQTLSGHVTRTLGSGGLQMMLSLVRHLPMIHDACPIEVLPDGLAVFVLPPGESVPDGYGEPTKNIRGYTGPETAGLTILVEGDLFRVALGCRTDWRQLPSVGYTFHHPRTELWSVGGVDVPVMNPTTDMVSVFGSAVFTELDTALDFYEANMVADCRCFELQRGWLLPNRWWWTQRPEVQVRRSLEQFLAGRLRDAIVEVEHVVDETKELDIFVSWAIQNQAALIECKWLGVSFSEQDSEGNRKTTSFSPATAVAGLAQLADYMDRQRPRAAGRALRGHLVVVDGRRKGIGEPDNPGSPTVAELFHYQTSSISWPATHSNRPDMGRPRRMFCRPQLT